MIKNMKMKRVKKEPKYVTVSAFEKATASIAKSFSRMDERFDRHDKAFSLLFKQMQKFTEEAREHRQAMSMLMRTDISQEKAVEELKIRVDRLEMRIK